MALIQYAAPWDRQPQEAVGVDWNNPLTNGLIFSSSLASGGGFRDEVGGLRPTINGTVAQGPTGDGTGAVFSGSDYLDFGASQIIPLGTPFTLTFYEEVTATSSYAAMLGLVAGSRQFLWIRGTSSYVCTLGVADGTAPVRFSSMPAQFVGERIRFVLTGDAIDSNSGLRLWANGVEQTSVASTFGTTSASSNKVGWDGADEKFQGRISDLHMLARRWSAEEVEAFFDAPWQLFAPQAIPVPVSAGGGGASGTSATTNASDTSSAGGTTTVTGTSSRTNANDTSSASGTTTVVGTSAKTNANDASSASGTTTVIGTLAKTNADDTSAASGTVGSSGTTGTVAATNANDTAAASGTTKIVGTLSTTNANDAATASGVAGAVSGTVAVTNANDTASAVGDAGAPVASGAGMGFSMSRMRRLVKIQFNGKLYQAFEEDIPELLETLEEQAEQKIKKKRNARAKPAPVATVVSAPADVLPSLQSRIDDVNHSIGVLWGVDEDEDEELLWLML